MAEWSKAPVSKTGRVFQALVGSNPTPSETILTIINLPRIDLDGIVSGVRFQVLGIR